MTTLLKCRACIGLFVQLITKKPNVATQAFITSFRRFPQQSILVTFQPNLNLNRTKSKASKKKQQAAESDEEESDVERQDFDDLVVDKLTKVVTIKVNSMRVDVVLKSGLSIARNKVEEMFYESKIRVNGKKILKKSDLVQAGDELDIIKGANQNNPKFLTVSRVEVLEVIPKNEAYSVRVRRCKGLVIENYEEPWKPGD